MDTLEGPDKSAEIHRLKTVLDAFILSQDQRYADMINIQIADLKKQILSARPLDMQIKGLETALKRKQDKRQELLDSIAISQS